MNTNKQLAKAIIEKDYNSFFAMSERITKDMFKKAPTNNLFYDELDDYIQEVNLVLWSRICGKRFDESTIVDCNKFYSYTNLEGFIRLVVRNVFKKGQDQTMKVLCRLEEYPDQKEELTSRDIENLVFIASTKMSPEEVVCSESVSEINKQVKTEHEALVKSTKRNLPVRAYDKKTRKVVGEYKNATEAATKLELSKSSVSKVLKGKRKSTGNYIFIYVTPSDSKNELLTEKVELAQNASSITTTVRATLKSTGEFAGEFTSTKQAAKALDLENAKIVRVLNNIQKTTKGYTFEYVTTYNK